MITNARQALVLTSTLLIAGTFQQAQAGVVEKAKFAFRLGVAYYAVNTWVLRPYRKSSFQVGAPGQKANIVKAGLALLFAGTQVNAAIKMTRNTTDPFLLKIGSLLPNFSKSLTAAGNNLKNGRFDEQGIQGVNRQTNNLLSSAENEGHPIRPVAIPIPGL